MANSWPQRETPLQGLASSIVFVAQTERLNLSNIPGDHHSRVHQVCSIIHHSSDGGVRFRWGRKLHAHLSTQVGMRTKHTQAVSRWLERDATASIPAKSSILRMRGLWGYGGEANP